MKGFRVILMVLVVAIWVVNVVQADPPNCPGKQNCECVNDPESANADCGKVQQKASSGGTCRVVGKKCCLVADQSPSCCIACGTEFTFVPGCVFDNKKMCSD